jgi:hypothetical protein
MLNFLLVQVTVTLFVFILGYLMNLSISTLIAVSLGLLISQIIKIFKEKKYYNSKK